MSDAPHSADGALPGHEDDLAGGQQQALEAALRAQAVGRAREDASDREATAQAELRAERERRTRSRRPRATLGRIRRSMLRHCQQLAARRFGGVGLAGLPTAPGSATPHWRDAVAVRGVSRPALIADPPAEYSWLLELPAGSAVHGWLALRPGAWEINSGGAELVLELQTPSGAVVGRRVIATNPRVRGDDRRWVPWRWALPTSGTHRLVLRTQAPAGASPEYAWVVIGDPRLSGRWLPRHQHRAATVREATPTPDPTPASGAPGLTILLPVHDPPMHLLEQTLTSIQQQTDPGWRLCIVDDGSRDEAVRQRLELMARDPRVTLICHEQAGGISAATNAAFAVAETAYVATLDHDDVLAPDAVACVRSALAADRSIDLLYSDNDLVAGEKYRFAASLKPDWSPDLLRAVMYTLHLGVYRRELVQAVGGWRSEFDGAQDHDLVLRLTERTDAVRHLPRILYHWRAHAGSAALGELAKPLAYERGRAAVAAQLQRLGVNASVEHGPQAGRYRVRYARGVPVTLVAAARESPTPGAETLRAGLECGDDLVTLPLARLSFGRALVQFAAQQPADRVLVILETALVPEADAIAEIAGHVSAGAAAAGGVVIDGSRRVVAGAVAFPVGLPVAVHPDALLDDDPHATLTLVTNRTAVRGAVAVAAGTVVEHAAAIERFDRLALVALTAAATDAGGRVVFSPHARFDADAAAASDLLRWPLAEAAGLDRGARPDPFWNPQRWADRGDETIPEAVHENPLIELPDA